MKSVATFRAYIVDVLSSIRFNLGCIWHGIHSMGVGLLDHDCSVHKITRGSGDSPNSKVLVEYGRYMCLCSCHLLEDRELVPVVVEYGGDEMPVETFYLICDLHDPTQPSTLECSSNQFMRCRHCGE